MSSAMCRPADKMVQTHKKTFVKYMRELEKEE